jgi:hypothetical protein
MNFTQLFGRKTIIIGQRNWFEPKLCSGTISFHMNVGRFSVFVGIKEKPILYGPTWRIVDIESPNYHLHSNECLCCRLCAIDHTEDAGGHQNESANFVGLALGISSGERGGRIQT